MVKGPLDRPVDFVNSPHTGPYDTCLDLRPELWAETDSAIMFVNPIVCFRSDVVANKIGRWTGAYFVPCDHKMLSVVGIHSTHASRTKTHDSPRGSTKIDFDFKEFHKFND